MFNELDDFFDYIAGKSEMEPSDNPVAYVEFQPYGDVIHYKDGSTSWRSIGD
jgi:hypothetical protein